MYPDRPYDIGELLGWEFNPETQRRERFLIARPEDMDRECLQAKERRLLEIVQAELRTGRRCHIYAVYTQKRDVTRRLESILAREGIRVAVLTSDVPTEKREAWFETKLQQGIQVTICHPKIIETGLDLLSHPSMIFYESGYSLHTLRQASRRSWRIGQRQPVRVYYLYYGDTMQSACLRLMGKKLLVSLAMEGKFSGEGLQTLDDGDDMLTAMARELVTERGIGEPAAVVWRQIQAEQGKMLPASDATVEPTPTTEEVLPTAHPIAPKLSVPVVADARQFGSRPLSERPLRRKEHGGDQLSLF
jgi:GAF domain-containing protein